MTDNQRLYKLVKEIPLGVHGYCTKLETEGVVTTNFYRRWTEYKRKHDIKITIKDFNLWCYERNIKMQLYRGGVFREYQS